MTKTIDTQIQSVTVYSDRALVVRRGTIHLAGEERELAIADLAPDLETESIRVSGRGTVAVRLLGVRTETQFVPQPTQEKIAEIEAQIRALEAEQGAIQAQIGASELRRDFIRELSNKGSGDLSLGLARQRVNLTDVGQWLDFIGQHYRNYCTELTQLERQRQDLNDAIAALKRQKQQLDKSHPYKSLNLIATIEPAGAGEFVLEAAYLVRRASWKPLYDLQIDTQKQTLHLSYLAEVKQSTGEDWSDVALTFSTAKPGLGGLPPQLAPWYISLDPPYPVAMPAAPKMRAMRAIEDLADESVSESTMLAAAASAPIEAESVATEISKAGSVVTFEVGGGGNIPSNGSPHQVSIFQDEYPSSFQYIAMPRLVSFAYLEAIAANPATGVTLLPGKANIFRDGTFVGTTELLDIAPGQEFRINLGIDEGLKIERDLVERQIDKKLIGAQRRMTFAYRLKITNLLSQTKALKLTEQLPISRHEKLKIRLTQSSPKIELKEMGILEWHCSIAPNTSQEIYYQFAIESPPEYRVYGLDI